MDDEHIVVGSPVEDSGYETSEPSCEKQQEPPGVLDENEKGEFEFNATMAFVTYTQSQVKDKEEFYRCLRDSIEAVLPRIKGTEEKVSVQIFGGRELHEDGNPHYHAVLKFSERVHFRKAREKFCVYILVDGERVVDTHSIHIRRKPEHETPGQFLQSVQAYSAKDNDTFGEWIDGKSSSAKEREKWEKALVECEYRDEAEAIIIEHFRKKWLWQQWNVQALLKTKKDRSSPRRERSYKAKPWRVSKRMLQWRRRNFPVKGGGRPTSLVLVGPSKVGKTEWATSFGNPAIMNGGWNLDELLREDVTHLVINDIDVTDFPHKRDLAGCQEYITATGKYRQELTVKWGKPVIWTCNEDNSVLLDQKLAKYFRESGAVIQEVKDVMYFEDVEE